MTIPASGLLLSHSDCHPGISFTCSLTHPPVHTHARAHTMRTANKNRARKAVKENFSGAAGQPWACFGLLIEEGMCSSGLGMIQCVLCALACPQRRSAPTHTHTMQRAPKPLNPCTHTLVVYNTVQYKQWVHTWSICTHTHTHTMATTGHRESRPGCTRSRQVQSRTKTVACPACTRRLSV